MPSPANTVVVGLVVVQKVAKSSHPNISCDENTDCIVDLLGLKVVIEKEQHLGHGKDITTISFLLTDTDTSMTKLNNILSLLEWKGDQGRPASTLSILQFGYDSAARGT